MSRAVVFGLGLRTDRDAANGDAALRELGFELAQLREWLSEETSTDVPQPKHEHGLRHVEIEHDLRRALTEQWFHARRLRRGRGVDPRRSSVLA